ncbi:MAG: DUF503 domain-containing protein [candidate division WOR-3 bacterium]
MFPDLKKDNKFFVGICKFDLHIHNCQSLKEKRRVIVSLEEKLKNRFNIALCEYGELDLWQRAQITTITCSNKQSVVDTTMKALIKYIEHFHPVTILNAECQIL